MGARDGGHSLLIRDRFAGLDRAPEVIYSCQSIEQLDMARTYANLALKLARIQDGEEGHKMLRYMLASRKMQLVTHGT